MDVKTLLLTDLASQAALGWPVSRREVRVWALSGVERVRFANGETLIFKAAREPFINEAKVLWHVHRRGVPVPYLLTSAIRGGMLGMLLEDLGDPVRDVTLADGVDAAVAVHKVDHIDGLAVLDREALAALPSQAIASLQDLRAEGRWTDSDLDRPLSLLASEADRLASGADIPPFSLCHSEFHPTSLHIGVNGWRLMDWARAFTGPGLLDLASWRGTQAWADPISLKRMISAYVEAGGAAEAAYHRAGLPPEYWALGWHRLWIIAWYLEQATKWMPDRRQDEFAAKVVRRHLDEAMTFLWVRTL